MHQTKITVRYFCELFGTLALFFIVLALSEKIGRAMPEGTGRTIILFSPMLPFLLMIGAVWRYFRQVDEYLRLQILENWAMTAAITFGWTFTYGFLENAGFPRISMFVICPAMGITSAILFVARRIVSR